MYLSFVRIVNCDTKKVVLSTAVHYKTIKSFEESVNNNEYMEILEDGVWKRYKMPKTIGGCEYCYGWGVYPDTDLPDGVKIPLNRHEAENGDYADPCEKCNADNFYYHTKASSANNKKAEDETRYMEILMDFEKLANTPLKW